MESPCWKALVLMTFIMHPLPGWAYTSHPEITVSRNLSAAVAKPGGAVTVTVNLAIGNIAAPLRGFYLTDQVPGGPAVSGQTATRNGSAVAFTSETGALNETYDGSTPLRWILETPPAFAENLPLGSGDTLSFTYQLVIPGAAQHGAVFTLKNLNWIGRLVGGTVTDVYGYEDLPEPSIAVDALAPDTPALVAVSPDPTADSTPLMDWDDVADGARFRIQIDDDPAFGSPAVDDDTLTASQHVPAPLGDAIWYWRVAALDAVGNQSDFSAADSFTLDAATPTSPTLVAYEPDPTSNNRPTLDWSDVAGAASYRLQVSAAADFSSLQLELPGLTSSAYAFGAALPDGQWFWRVSATTGAGVDSAFSTVDDFTVDTVPPEPPVLVAHVPDPTLDATPTLHWSAAGGASRYRVQISRASDFAALLVDEPSVTVTSFTPAAWLAPGIVYWRVSAIDAAGNESAFPSPDSFAVQAISRLDVDRKIRDLRAGTTSEAEVLEFIQRYSAGN